MSAHPVTAQTVYDAYMEAPEDLETLEMVLAPLATLNKGTTTRPAEWTALQKTATCFDDGAIWVVPHSVTCSSEFGAPARKLATILIAGDLHIDGPLTWGCSIYVAGNITCSWLYKNLEIESLFAQKITAQHYVYVEYPGASFVAFERIEAPVVFFSGCAWRCPSVVADVLLEDYSKKQVTAQWKQIAHSAGLDMTTLSHRVGRRGASAVQHALRNGHILER